MEHNASTADGAHSWSEACSPSFLHRLDRLRINISGGTTQHPGSNPVATATQNSGLEFAKHRPYTPGDELRHIDWNALARHDTKLVRTFRAEREAPLHLLIDGSASMGVPVADGKLAVAAALATFLAYVALRNRDPVHTAVITSQGARAVAPLLRHPQRLHVLSDALATIAPAGATDLAVGTAAYLRTTRLPGIAIVISDFLVEAADYQRTLHILRASGYAVAALRVIGATERDPAAQVRRARLYDVETKSEKIIDFTAENRALYAKAFAQHEAALRSWCESTAIPYGAIATDRPPDQVISADLPRSGILR